MTPWSTLRVDDEPAAAQEWVAALGYRHPVGPWRTAGQGAHQW